MRYRVQVTVGIGRLAAIIEAACKDNPEPDLTIEQVPEHPMVEAPKIGTAIQRVVKATKAKPAATGTRQEIVEAALKTGPKRWAELKEALTAGGLAESSLNTMIGQLKKNGKIRRSEDGLWSLVEHERTATA